MTSLKEFERLIERKGAPEVWYAWLKARAELIASLKEIADADYRGNRSPEAVALRRLLEAEGLR